MVLTKEFKGTAKEPNIDRQLNEFFETMTEHDQIVDIMYSTALLPVKKEGSVHYIITSTALIFYDKYEEE